MNDNLSSNRLRTEDEQSEESVHVKARHYFNRAMDVFNFVKTSVAEKPLTMSWRDQAYKSVSIRILRTCGHYDAILEMLYDSPHYSDSVRLAMENISPSKHDLSQVEGALVFAVTNHPTNYHIYAEALRLISDIAKLKPLTPSTQRIVIQALQVFPEEKPLLLIGIQIAELAVSYNENNEDVYFLELEYFAMVYVGMVQFANDKSVQMDCHKLFIHVYQTPQYKSLLASDHISQHMLNSLVIFGNDEEMVYLILRLLVEVTCECTWEMKRIMGHRIDEVHNSVKKHLKNRIINIHALLYVVNLSPILLHFDAIQFAFDIMCRFSSDQQIQEVSWLIIYNVTQFQPRGHSSVLDLKDDNACKFSVAAVLKHPQNTKIAAFALGTLANLAAEFDHSYELRELYKELGLRTSAANAVIQGEETGDIRLRYEAQGLLDIIW